MEMRDRATSEDNPNSNAAHVAPSYDKSQRLSNKNFERSSIMIVESLILFALGIGVQRKFFFPLGQIYQDFYFLDNMLTDKKNFRL